MDYIKSNLNIPFKNLGVKAGNDVGGVQPLCMGPAERAEGAEGGEPSARAEGAERPEPAERAERVEPSELAEGAERAEDGERAAGAR